MCAIAGVIDWNAGGGPAPEICEQMLQTMRQRGPDQTGSYRDNEALLLSARLCVTDPDGGCQPMEAWRGGEHFVLVCDGEIYNADEVRAELTGLGLAPRTRSDAEVLLNAYLAWGEGCLDKLNGVFAFAIWQERARRLFLARDRMGARPLFYAVRGKKLLFASELKTLLAHPAVEPVVGPEGVAEIMLLGPGRTPGCGVFRGVEELEPAHCALCGQGGLRSRRYWSLSNGAHNDTFDQTVEKVRWLVLDAIERQLPTDVPMCVLLSGGLDSGILAAVAARRWKELGLELRTFSVDYEGSDHFFTAGRFEPESDGRYIGLMRRALGVKHENVVLKSEDLAAALLDAVLARDLPGMADVDASMLLLCREVGTQAKVALSGECADEIFGGYPWFRDEGVREKYGFPWAQSTSYRAEFLRPEWQSLIDAEAYVDRRFRDTLRQAPLLAGQPAAERRMKEMTCLNERWFMQTLLDRQDRMGMHAGVELRAPFCDHRVAEYLYTVPWEMKEYHGHEKGLLRHAMRDLLPQKVLWRKKSPYPKTHHPAYRAAVSRMLRDILDDPSSPLLGLMQREPLELLLHCDRSIPWYGQLMTTPQTIAYMVQVNIWMKAYGVRLAG